VILIKATACGIETIKIQASRPDHLPKRLLNHLPSHLLDRPWSTLGGEMNRSHPWKNNVLFMDPRP